MSILALAVIVATMASAVSAAASSKAWQAKPLVPAAVAPASAGDLGFAAAQASPAVHIAPGSLFGYIPLDLFGVTPIAIGDEEAINFTVPPFVYNGATHSVIGV